MLCLDRNQNNNKVGTWSYQSNYTEWSNTQSGVQSIDQVHLIRGLSTNIHGKCVPVGPRRHLITKGTGEGP